MISRYSIIILNWNGRTLITECLRSVLLAIQEQNDGIEVLIVDNGSTDGSVEFINEKFPSVKIIPLDKNYGYGGGNNRGVYNAKGDIVILLNNDMVVDKNFLTPLLKPFENEDVFAVGCQIFFKDSNKRREETGKTFAYWDQGTVRYLHQDITEFDNEREYIPISWASGGAVAFDKKKFLELGGFKSIYHPAYTEDVDISYRAWKRGWKSLLAVKSIVYHKHRASSSKLFDRTELDILVKRNHYLFVWSNITSLRMLIEHFLTLPMRLIKYRFVTKDKLELKAFILALSKFKTARNLSKEGKRYWIYRDEDLLKFITWKRKFLSQFKKLQILFVSPYIPCLGIHATGNRMFHIIKELSQKHSISVITYFLPPSEGRYIRSLKEFCKDVIVFPRVNSYDESDYFHIKPNLVIREHCSREMKERLVREVVQGKYDIVQFEYLQMAYLSRYVKHCGIPHVWVNHEIQHSALWRQFLNEKFLSLKKIELFFRWMVMLSFEIKIAKSLDRTIVVSPQDQKELTCYLPKLSSSVVPIGVDLDFFANNLESEEENRLIFTGYFLHTPNVDAVLYYTNDILPFIWNEIDDIKFDIVGAHPPDEVQQLANDKRITVTGWVSDLREYLKRAVIYVAPLRLGAGIRGKILEAMAMSKPIVATSLAMQGIPAVHEKEVLIADSPEEFATQVIMLLKNREMRRRLGENARKLVERNFGWQHISELNEKALLDTLNGFNKTRK